MMSSSKPSNAVPTLRWLYLACVVLGSIGAHLISEYAAMGSDAAVVAVSPRHLYLAIAGIAALAFAIRELMTLRARASNGRDAKRLAEIGLAGLPFAGKRHFWLVTAGLQFAFGGFTEIGEGCPLCGHDVIAGVAGALVGAIVLSLIARALSARLPSIASALVEFAPVAGKGAHAWKTAAAATPIVLAEFLWYARLFNRPPPALQPALNRHH
jgi:hypothetical protein